MRCNSLSSANEIELSTDDNANRHRSSDSFCSLRRQGRQLPGDEEVGRAAEQQIAFRGELDDGRGLIGGELALVAHNCFHGARLFRRDAAIGVGNASQDVGERSEKSGAFRFQVLERLERLAEWRRLV